MKVEKIIGFSVMTMLFATLMVSVASAAGSSYGSAEYFTVADEDYAIITATASQNPEWWQFSASVGDNIYTDLDYTFSQDGGAEYLHDRWQGDIQAAVSLSLSDHRAILQANHPHIQINRGTSSYYEFLVTRNWL